MSAYYNEIDLHAAQWLRNLIKAGHIADGVVDTRSIEDVQPDDLREFTQCHFFAGIGVWSYALRAAGWDDDRPIWTGSCPCQPFSAAGEGLAFADERHLWPAFHHLIKVGKPPIVVGEQVASKAVDAWIDLVHADLEAVGYAFGSVPFPSAGVGAPHIRDRNYWVADAEGKRRERGQDPARSNGRSGIKTSGFISGLANSHQHGRNAHAGSELHHAEYHAESRRDVRGLADDQLQQRQGSSPGGDVSRGREQEPAETAGLRRDLRPGPNNGFWRDADWLGCTDGKWRPVEPGTFPLANGSAARVGRLRGYGNAINAEAARVFVEAVMESTS